MIWQCNLYFTIDYYRLYLSLSWRFIKAVKIVKFSNAVKWLCWKVYAYFHNLLILVHLIATAGMKKYLQYYKIKIKIIWTLTNYLKLYFWHILFMVKACICKATINSFASYCSFMVLVPSGIFSNSECFIGN